MVMLEKRPHMPAAELSRMDSPPSLSHSTHSVTDEEILQHSPGDYSDGLLSPFFSSGDGAFADADPYPASHDYRRDDMDSRKSSLTSRSMQGLRSRSIVTATGAVPSQRHLSKRLRSKTFSESKNVVMPIRAPYASPVPIEQIQPPPSKTPGKTGGSISSIFRKLTRRTPKSHNRTKLKDMGAVIEQEDIPPVPPVPRLPSSLSAPTRGEFADYDSRQELAVPSRSRSKGGSKKHHGKMGKSSSAPLFEAAEVPLPLSPLVDDDSIQTPSLSDHATTTSTQDPPASDSDSSLKRTQGSRKLPLEHFDEDDENDTYEREEYDDDSDEAVDIVKPLEPLEIQIGALTNTRTGSITSSVSEMLVTPTSYNEDSSPRMSSEPRFAGSSPPRRAPVGSSPNGDLVRKESKWKKSITAVSEFGSKGVPRQKAQSRATPPPTSYDVYMASQRRLANDRMSCAPTIHSTASIAVEVRAIKDRDQQDLADTFFLS